MPLTVTHLATACGLSRSTILYYERLGLLAAARRSSGNYRVYGEKDLARLRQICIYRAAGLKLNDIRRLLTETHGDAATVLKRRLAELDGEIEKTARSPTGDRAAAQRYRSTEEVSHGYERKVGGSDAGRRIH